MPYNPAIHYRRSIRLPGYDYTQSGAYFVTICAYQKECLFGEIVDGQMRLNQYGQIVADEWKQSSVIRKEIQLDASIVMPNHFHGIVVITNNMIQVSDRVEANNPVGANCRSPLQSSMKPKSLSSLIAGFKSITTKQINILRNAPGTSVWQRNYYEHIIRSQDALNRIREYIINNPNSWETDQLNPQNSSKW